MTSLTHAHGGLKCHRKGGGGDGQAAGPPKRRSPLDFLDNIAYREYKSQLRQYQALVNIY